MARMDKTESPLPTPPMPALVRLPQSGQKEPWSGLARGQMDLLTRPQAANDFKPPVKSYILAMKGAARGVRLVALQSLLAHLSTLPNVWPKQGKARRVAAKAAHQGRSSK